jgi:hypothetical protein
MAVVEIRHNGTYDEKGLPKEHGLCDARMVRLREGREKMIERRPGTQPFFLSSKLPLSNAPMPPPSTPHRRVLSAAQNVQRAAGRSATALVTLGERRQPFAIFGHEDIYPRFLPPVVAAFLPTLTS